MARLPRSTSFATSRRARARDSSNSVAAALYCGCNPAGRGPSRRACSRALRRRSASRRTVGGGAVSPARPPAAIHDLHLGGAPGRLGRFVNSSIGHGMTITSPTSTRRWRSSLTGSRWAYCVARGTRPAPEFKVSTRPRGRIFGYTPMARTGLISQLRSQLSPINDVGQGFRHYASGDRGMVSLHLSTDRVFTMCTTSPPRRRVYCGRPPVVPRGGSRVPAEWRIAFTTGLEAPIEQRVIPAGDCERLRRVVADGKRRGGLAATAPVRRCYEAGRDGFWPHRLLEAEGVTNVVVDAASIEVRGGRAARRRTGWMRASW